MSAHPEFYIGTRAVGYDHPPLVIAEIGINHEGSLDVAIEMVDAAIRAGAEVIKHQTHIIEDEMSSEARGVIPGNADVSIYDIMERCALNEDDERALMEHVERQGAIFISTPFSRAAAERLERFGVQAYKIGSGECNNYPLIEHIASLGKPIILSTGMNSLDAIEPAVDIMRRAGVPFCLLHCTNLYPTPDHLIRLGGINALADHFPDAVVGLSDHSADHMACVGAVAVGASVLERHFTDHKSRQGPDIVCSMDPEECSLLIHEANRMQKMRGGTKGAVPEEKPTIDFAYASVVAIAPIKEGETLSKDNIWVKRPGSGDFSAAEYNALLGRVAARDIQHDVQLKREDVK
ncbi:N-acetylneuraminate synthase family protein [Larsenimonas rhizosphaerae]|uniref:N-acetylneuraminate synthase family protein n=1 Tax=Larsenimonas rhizosphaerae TaxID=2944682 RepID=A0AA41ZGH4_9GAMM|nr:N-acetylneuraminate synthase family protein [Larsenimonas rhizosphaerae]MCM2131832.1 N-acetylneuraminate synthase family protein [Larsenimonas rhizosphaerae]MCX2524852.1 N-acetylneuraminate synthase family protein [Larsenimonas rhizosphaerae]